MTCMICWIPNESKLSWTAVRLFRCLWLFILCSFFSVTNGPEEIHHCPCFLLFHSGNGRVWSSECTMLGWKAFFCPVVVASGWRKKNMHVSATSCASASLQNKLRVLPKVGWYIFTLWKKCWKSTFHDHGTFLWVIPHVRVPWPTCLCHMAASAKTRVSFSRSLRYNPSLRHSEMNWTLNWSGMEWTQHCFPELEIRPLAWKWER